MACQLIFFELQADDERLMVAVKPILAVKNVINEDGILYLKMT
jgi:hypothetical protein